VNDLILILLVAVITFGSRAVFLVRRRQVPEGLVGRFLEVFPLALFIALATTGLAAPDGYVAVTPALGGAAGGVVGAFATRRSLVGTILIGAAGYWLARMLVG
jgi:branched-subunit amino acid transport protein